MTRRIILALCSAFLLLSNVDAAAAPKAAFALERQEVLTHFQTVDPADLDEARAEIAYLRSISQPKQAFVNNLADDKQLRFTLRNLKKAGKTPQNAPQLFATIAQQRAKHKQAAPVALVSLTTVPPTTDQRIALNMLTDLSQVSGATAPTYTATGLSSIPDGTVSTLAFVQLFDASNNTPFGPGASIQQFGSGENLNVTQTSAPTTAVSDVGAALQVTYQASTTTDPVTVSYLAAVTGAPLAPPTVTAPQSKFTPPNPQIKVCLSRNLTPDPDCDYGPFENPTANPIVQLPVSGTIAFNANVDTTRAVTGTLIVWAQNGGGGCTLHFGDTQFAPAFSVDRQNPAKLNWTFTHQSGTTPIATASFGQLGNNPCWQPGQPYGMTLDVNVPTVGSVLPQNFFVTTTPGPPVGNATRILPLTFTWGCFAAGSRVLMADGSVKVIEDVKSGDAVIADGSGRKLTVRQTTAGLEALPMVIITDAKGHTLSITDGHPVVIRNGRNKTKVVLAKELKEGDVVFTSDLALENGKPRRFATSQIVKIERKKYDGRVYNVYLGVKENGEQFDTSNTTLIANGILTGDNAMQEFYGAAFNFKPKNVKDRIPREWHADYEHHLAQQAKP